MRGAVDCTAVTSDGEQKMNRYNPPMQDGERGASSAFVIIVLFVACFAMVLISIAVSGHAIFKILDTTPFMGIPVDARGNRIPIQGYPQLGFGLASAVLFTILAFFFGMRLHWSNKFSLRTLLIAITAVAVVLGVIVYFAH